MNTIIYLTFALRFLGLNSLPVVVSGLSSKTPRKYSDLDTNKNKVAPMLPHIVALQLPTSIISLKPIAYSVKPT
jgi:hypothetical protein